MTLLLGQWFLRREMQKEKIEWIKKFKHSHPDQDGEMAYAQHVKNLQNKHGDKILVQRALEKVVIKKGILGDMAATVLSALLKKLQSPGRIGIAPLVSYTYAEDFHAEKIQLQVFAVAIAKLNAVLQNQEGIEHIQFCVLPAHCKIMNNRQAAFFSRLFGLDVLLWGSYLDAGGEIVWLNIYRAYAAKDKEKDSDDTGLDFQFGIFPWKVQVEMPVVTFPQKDCRDAYIVMVVALVQALQAREVKCSDRKRKFNFLVRQDRLYLASSEMTNSLVLHLVTNALQFLPKEPISDEVLPSAKAQLVEIAGKWIGLQLAKDNDESLWERVSPKRIAVQLYAIAEKCSLLIPNTSEHFYRLGAIACILGEKEKALHNFKLAGEVDALSTRVHSIAACVLAERALENNGDKEFSLARFAAHAACAINTKDVYALKQIQEAMDKASTIPKDSSTPKPISVLVVETMLSVANSNRKIEIST